MSRNKFDQHWIGITSGLILPVLALMVYYLVRFEGLSLADFLKVYKNLGILTHIISLSVIPDLLLFFFFIRQNFLKSARGVLGATFVFTFLVLIIRFL